MISENNFYRFLDVIENEIAPLTAKAVETGSRVFGAAVLRKSDLSLVIAETNHAAYSPLWHGEIYTLKLFFELQGHPDPSDCIFLATHQPCCMCTSALAWSGFKEIYYLFGYKHTADVFGMPHDLRMNREIFGCDEPMRKNSYFEWHSLEAMLEELPDFSRARSRFETIRSLYARFASVVEARESKDIIV